MKLFKPTVLSCAVMLSASSSAALFNELEEIVVTAQKREQSVQDVGIAVTAFSGDQMKQLGYTNAQQVTAMTPGVTTIQPNGPSAFFVSIRGVGQNDFSGDHQESPVAIYVDETYISAASGAGFQLFDIERTEVLRGPQGTLFGRNATGGLVHYITKKPSQEFEAYADIKVGDFNQVTFEGAVGGALSETVSARVSMVRNEHDGYVKNTIGTDLNNGDDWAARAQLLFEFNDSTSWLISARAAEQDIDTGFFEHSSARLNPATGLGEDFDGPDLTDGVGSSVTSPWQEPDDGVHRGSYNVIGYNRLESWGATSNFSKSFDNFDLVAITDFWHLEKDYLEDSDASPNDFFNFFLGSDLDQVSQEIRVQGDTERLRWVAGAFYLKIEGDFSNGGPAENFFSSAFETSLAGTGVGLYNPFSTETESTAFFGQIDYDLSDSFTVIAGLRWSNEQKNVQYDSYIAGFVAPDDLTITDLDVLGLGGSYFSYGANGVTSLGADLAVDGNHDNIDKDLVTAKLELDWRYSENTLVYLSYNRGIKAGGFNAPLDPSDLVDGVASNGGPDEMKFDEEILHAYELGIKTELFDGKARLNTAVYYYDYQDYQAFRLEGLTQFVFNTDAQVQGFEVELQASPLKGLDLMMGVGYVDNTVEDAYQLPNGDLVDRTAVLTPEWNVNGLLRYEWSALEGTLAVQADFTYMDDHFFQIKNSPVGAEDAYTLSNARVSYTSADDSWGVAAFVNNVTDEEYRQMAFDLAGTAAQGGFGLTESYYGAPRWWGVSFNYNWR